MITFTPPEARVLGVLVEKAYTTPGQYPMTLNALVSGCNQKSNREPVTNYDEDVVQDALDHLRAKQIVREVYPGGSRVAKFRQVAKETLGVEPMALAVLAELLLRGPQTLGELRGRAQRMQAMDSIEVTREVLDGLMHRETPLVRMIAPAPGSRAERYMQLLCPNLHRVQVDSAGPRSNAGGEAGPSRGAATASPSAPAPAPAAASPAGGTADGPTASADGQRLAERLTRAEAEIERLQRAVRRIADSLGEGDPLAE